MKISRLRVCEKSEEQSLDRESLVAVLVAEGTGVLIWDNQNRDSPGDIVHRSNGMHPNTN